MTTNIPPNIQHRGRFALLDDIADGRYPPRSGQAQWETNKNACLLPFQYARFQDPEILRQDPIYFGMNFSDFGQGDLNLWIYVPTAAIIIAISFGLWHLAGLVIVSKNFCIGKRPQQWVKTR
ncbi:hypothetical protein EDB80DRAFT_880757 [Ilyonectria destructans]|nr:hypothetical protein EDB80DRAFT_880757 [Ilyonectria destructans]